MEHIWSYFIQLGHNMWRDASYHAEFNGPAQTQATGRFKAEMYTDREVWKETVDFLPSCGINVVVIDIGEGLLYETHPELSVKGAWTREELKKELARMRLMGLEPIPKLNFSAYHDEWLGEYSRMLGTRKYYEVVADLIDEVCEVFDEPRFFHLGLDEEYIPDHRKAVTVIRSTDLWYHDLYFYMKCLEKHGSRPWVWADPSRRDREEYVRRMPHECIQSEGSYERIVTNGKSGLGGLESMVVLGKHGYDQIPCVSTWACDQNAAQIINYFENQGIMDEHFLGLLDAPWAPTDNASRYTLLNDAYRMKYAKEMFERRHPELL
jgi:hypothetical protein